MPDDDFSRRTLLANERTYLAWWRTGLVCLTVALATARVVPELSGATTQWPYTVLGGAFGVLGVFCVAYGDHRRRAVVAALQRDDYAEAGTGALVLTTAGVVLGLALTLVLMLDT